MKMKGNEIAGITIVLLNLWWTSNWVWLFYAYDFSSILFYYMHPDWVLLLDIVIGFIGVLIGYIVFMYRLSVFKAIVLDSLLLILGISVSFFIA
jgi:hypothetical protein